MIQHFFRAKYLSKIKEIDKLRAGVWVHAQAPNHDEIKTLISDYGMDEGALQDALDPYEVPRLVHGEGNWSYVYVRVPAVVHSDVLVSKTIPICIAIGPENVFTISKYKIKDLWEAVSNTDILTTQKVRLLSVIVGEVAKFYNKEIAFINRKLRKYAIEEKLIHEEDVVLMLTYERSLNDFLDALVPMATIMKSVHMGKSMQSFKQDQDLIEDVQLNIEQLVIWAKSTLRTIQNTRDAYSTVLTNRLNNSIHHLTIITISLAVPTMIAGLYGMNVDLPGQGHKLAFFAVLAFSLLIAGLIYVNFKKRS